MGLSVSCNRVPEITFKLVLPGRVLLSSVCTGSIASLASLFTQILVTLLPVRRVKTVIAKPTLKLLIVHIVRAVFIGALAMAIGSLIGLVPE